MRRRARGYTLVELAVTAALAALLVLVALPSLRDPLTKARRADATAALQRLQMAQERHHAQHGLYAADLRTLGAAPTSTEGLYAIELEAVAGDGYRAVARARAGGAQAADRACAEIRLRVEHGFAETGPDPRCWDR